MRTRFSRGLVAMVVPIALVAATCGGNDDEGRESGNRRDRERQQPTTTQAPASDEAAVRPHIEDLLAAWDEGMTPILADPRPVFDDPDHRLRRELAETFTADSPYIRDLGQLLQGYIDQDTGLRPGRSGLVQQTTFLNFTQAPDADHLSFVACTFTDGRDYVLSTGADRPPSVGIRHVAGDATRVDGEWRLHRLQRLSFQTEPAGTPNPCPDMENLPQGGGQS